MSDTELMAKSEPVRRLEIFTGSGRRRSWSAEQKAEIKRRPSRSAVEFPDLGHSPQIQAPARFHAALLGWLHHPEAGVPQTR
jgi:pimeloyl-ACP methyl ester carboxylesterase